MWGGYQGNYYTLADQEKELVVPGGVSHQSKWWEILQECVIVSVYTPVMGCWVMLTWHVTKIALSGRLCDVQLALCTAIDQPVESHVDQF